MAARLHTAGSCLVMDDLIVEDIESFTGRIVTHVVVLITIVIYSLQLN